MMIKNAAKFYRKYLMPSITVLSILCSTTILGAQILISFFIFDAFGEHEEHNFEKNLFIFSCISLEFLFNFLGMILVILWGNLLRKSSILIHWNLKVACMAECFCIFIVCFTRCIIEIDEIYNGEFLLKKFRFIIKIVHDTTNYQYFIIHACIAIERSLATFFVSIYENIGKQRCWITFMFGMGLAAIPCHLIPRYILKDYFLLVYSVIVIEIIVGIVCILLFRINLQSYRNPAFNQELTARYQTRENIKNLRQIIVFIFFALVHNILIVIYAIFIFLLWLPKGNQKDIANMDALWNVTNSIFAVIYPLIFIVNPQKFRKVYSLWNWRKSEKISPYLEQELPESRSIAGEQRHNQNDQDVHFHELKKMWDKV